MRKFTGAMPSLSALLVTGAACAASGAFSWGAVAPSSQLFGPTIRLTGDPSAMALTFDDGPNPAVTPALLDLLDRHNARATFFLIGRHVRAFPALAKEIGERGHTVGNHTDTHPALTFLPPRRIADELSRCDDAIEAATGHKPRWMRPPFGFRGPQLGGIVRSRGGPGGAVGEDCGSRRGGGAGTAARKDPAPGGPGAAGEQGLRGGGGGSRSTGRGRWGIIRAW